jgi:hypothetical protein
MTEITFTGNLDQITNMIDSYKLKGYVYKSHTEQTIDYLAQGQKRKMILYSVVMVQKPTQLGIYINDELIGQVKTCLYNANTGPSIGLNEIRDRINKPLQDQLEEAVEREELRDSSYFKRQD